MKIALTLIALLTITTPLLATPTPATALEVREDMDVFCSGVLEDSWTCYKDHAMHCVNNQVIEFKRCTDYCLSGGDLGTCTGAASAPAPPPPPSPTATPPPPPPPLSPPPVAPPVEEKIEVRQAVDPYCEFVTGDAWTCFKAFAFHCVDGKVVEQRYCVSYCLGKDGDLGKCIGSAIAGLGGPVAEGLGNGLDKGCAFLDGDCEG